MPDAASVRNVLLQGTSAVHHRDAREVVWLWRRGRGPLERVGFPRVIARGLPVAQDDAEEEVPEEHDDPGRDDVRAGRRDEDQAGPLGRLWIVEGPPRHPVEAGL